MLQFIADNEAAAEAAAELAAEAICPFEERSSNDDGGAMDPGAARRKRYEDALNGGDVDEFSASTPEPAKQAESMSVPAAAAAATKSKPRPRSVWRCTLLYSTLLYSTLLYSTLLYSTLLFCVLLYAFLMCDAIASSCCALLCSTDQLVLSGGGRQRW